MKLKNNAKQKIIVEEIIAPRGFLKQTAGLILYKRAVGMILRSRFGIHTFFMRYPIDVIILDNDRRVRVIRKNLGPNRIFFWNPKYNFIIELPKGALAKSQTEQGDLLEFI